MGFSADGQQRCWSHSFCSVDSVSPKGSTCIVLVVVLRDIQGWSLKPCWSLQLTQVALSPAEWWHGEEESSPQTLENQKRRRFGNVKSLCVIMGRGLEKGGRWWDSVHVWKGCLVTAVLAAHGWYTLIQLHTPPKHLGTCAHSSLLPITLDNECGGRPDKYIWWFPWTKNKWSNLKRAFC